MQAIETRYHGPTNFRGSRVSATAQAGRIYVHWDHAKNIEQNHDAAARALALKLEWYGKWVGGGLPSGRGNCYVSLPGTRRKCADAKRVIIVDPWDGKPAR